MLRTPGQRVVGWARWSARSSIHAMVPWAPEASQLESRSGKWGTRSGRVMLRAQKPRCRARSSTSRRSVSP